MSSNKPKRVSCKKVANPRPATFGKAPVKKIEKPIVISEAKDVEEVPPPTSAQNSKNSKTSKTSKQNLKSSSSKSKKVEEEKGGKETHKSNNSDSDYKLNDLSRSEEKEEDSVVSISSSLSKKSEEKADSEYSPSEGKPQSAMKSTSSIENTLKREKYKGRAFSK